MMRISSRKHNLINALLAYIGTRSQLLALIAIGEWKNKMKYKSPLEAKQGKLSEY